MAAGPPREPREPLPLGPWPDGQECSANAALYLSPMARDGMTQEEMPKLKLNKELQAGTHTLPVSSVTAPII